MRSRTYINLFSSRAIGYHEEAKKLSITVLHILLSNVRLAASANEKKTSAKCTDRSLAFLFITKFQKQGDPSSPRVQQSALFVIQVSISSLLNSFMSSLQLGVYLSLKSLRSAWSISVILSLTIGSHSSPFSFPKRNFTLLKRFRTASPHF